MNRSPSDVLMVAAVLAGLAVLACDRSRESAVTAPTVPRYLETADVTTPCVWARQVQGVAESGALYAMFLPDRWNRRLERRRTRCALIATRSPTRALQRTAGR